MKDMAEARKFEMGNTVTEISSAPEENLKPMSILHQYFAGAKFSVFVFEYAICYHAVLLSSRTCYCCWLPQSALQECNAILHCSQQLSRSSSIAHASFQPHAHVYDKVGCILQQIFCFVCVAS